MKTLSTFYLCSGVDEQDIWPFRSNRAAIGIKRTDKSFVNIFNCIESLFGQSPMANDSHFPIFIKDVSLQVEIPSIPFDIS
jgi:hypothetical protein